MSESPDLRVSVIIPVHNRRELTLECLAHLSEVTDVDSYDTVVVDDGSSDGTGVAIARNYEDVILLQGDGNLFWGGAIDAGMRYAVAELDADVLLWLNDDVHPDAGAVMRLATAAYENDSVLAARTEAPDEPEFTVCHQRTASGLENVPYDDTDRFQWCDAVSGKFTAIPRAVVDSIGYPNTETFPHGKCDWDYTLRATEAGFDVGVDHDTTATDVHFVTAKPRLHPDVTFKTAFFDTFVPGRRSGRSIVEEYRRWVRFRDVSPPVAGVYLVARSIAALILKGLLVVVSANHQFDTQTEQETHDERVVRV